MEQQDNSFDQDDLSEQIDDSLISQLTQLDIKPVLQPEHKVGLSVRQQKANVVIYIIFTNFRKEVQEICKKFHCDIRLSMSSYMIANRDAEAREEFGKCCKEIEDFINSINYEKLGNYGDSNKAYHLKDKVRYTHSPYFTTTLRQKHIELIAFHEEVYAYSRKLGPKDMIHEIISFTKNKFIFPVRYNKQSPRHGLNENYPEIKIYLNKIIDFYGEFIKERNIIVELNTSRDFIYIIGQRQKYLMEVKQTFKNVVESMVCLTVKNTVINEKQLVKFLEKASTFPIHYGKLSEKRSVIISKDNILRQLISKSQGFFKYLGIDLSLENQEAARPKFGIYITPSLSFKTKIERARDICKEKGCDLFNNLNVYYVNQVFHHEKLQSNEEIRSLLCKIMQSLEENKQKFETMSRIKPKDQEPSTNAQNPLKYSLKGGRCPDKALSALMKRDVLSEKVQMKKEFLIAFNVVQTKQRAQYWKMKENGEQGEEVSESELKPGKYLRGLKKIGDDNSVVYMFEEIVEVI